MVNILTQAEEEFVGMPHAFKGWTKLEAIYRKAAGVPEGARRPVLEFLVESLYHLQASGAMSGGEFSKRSLSQQEELVRRRPEICGALGRARAPLRHRAKGSFVSAKRHLPALAQGFDRAAALCQDHDVWWRHGPPH